MNKKTIKDINFNNKAVLVRVDYNVPLKKNGDSYVVVDNERISASLETIKYILAQKPKRVVLMSHLGRPEGEQVEEFSLKPVVAEFEKISNLKLLFFTGYEKEQVRDQIMGFKNGELILLENLRFYKEEELNQASFAKKLADLGEVYVNEAFSNSHRSHASMVGICDFLPSAMGFELEKEIKVITQTINDPQSPFVVIIGGAKATTKIPILEKLFIKADYVLLGGGVANTFLKAMGYEIGHSLYSPESLRISQNLIWRSTRANTRLYLPGDVVVGAFDSGRKQAVASIEKIPLQLQALDIGPKTRMEYAQIIAKAKTIIWNGPMGATEHKDFAAGNTAIYEAVIANQSAKSVVGGGETISSLEGRKDLSKITHVSTGGGAMLEFIEKDGLPGIDALTNK